MGGGSLEEYFIEKLEDLHPKDLVKELIILGSHPAAHKEHSSCADWAIDTMLGREEKYTILTEFCKARKHPALNHLIKDLDSRYRNRTGLGFQLLSTKPIEEKYATAIKNYSGIDWKEFD